MIMDPNNVENSENRGTVVVAEDNDSNFQLVNAILKKETNIVRAVNGQEAVDFVKNGVGNIVLMDIKMPIMNGLDATMAIREFNKEIPIIALTANAFDSDKERALEAGCNDFIAKPLKKSDLIFLIHKWMGGETAE